ncbi:MAG: hypothetical protein JOZ73_06945, partial [Solirubrobacterales bacterium]|nr:hypothetical protein [Solirubrobacterales bacterium]
LSTPLLLASVVVVLIFSPLAFLATIGAFVFLFSAVEAIARRRLVSFVASIVLLVLAIALIVGFVRLLLTHWRTAIAVVVSVAALALLAANFLELLRRR